MRTLGIYSSVALATLGLASLSCVANLAGANLGARAPGSGDSGIRLAAFHEEVAVSTTGRYALYPQGDQLLLLDIEKRSVRVLQQIARPQIAAFWPDSKGFFCVSVVQEPGSPPRHRLQSIDVGSLTSVWTQPLELAVVGMQMSSDGSRLALWSESTAVVIDPTTGVEKGRFSVTGRIADVDVLGPHRLLVITEDPRARRRGAESLPTAQSPTGPLALIHVRNLLDGSDRCTARVANCADELVPAREGTRAFLAPTSCGRDPVTVLDLANCSTLATLPGFGPVALVDEGKTAIAFLDQGAESSTAPARDSSARSRYGLSFIDTATLRYNTIPLGGGIPRYAATPDNKSLIIDSALGSSQIRILSLEQRTAQTVRGPAIALRNFVVLPDSSHLFAVLNGLYDLDLAQRRIDSLPLPFLPIAINVTPEGKYLLLLDDQLKLHFLDPITKESVAEISGP